VSQPGARIDVCAAGSTEQRGATNIARKSRPCRWILAFLLVLIGLLALVWHDIGVDLLPGRCEQVVNPGLAKNAAAAPTTVTICHDPALTDPPIVFALLLALLLIVPDLAEVSIPGFVRLKTRVDRQGDDLSDARARIEALAVDVHAIADARSSARADATSDARAQVEVLVQGSAADDVDAILQLSVAMAAIEGVLRGATSGEFAEVEFRVYKHDGGRLLVPIGPGFVAQDNFKVGRGATGQAWTRKASFVVLGPEASDQTHGLTPAQQEHFKDLTIVGATPVLDKGGNRLGVLTVGSKRMLDGVDVTHLQDTWATRMEVLARQLALVLRDLMRVRAE
jgi:hypothetical protein